MDKLNIMFFGSMPGKVNNIRLSHALDNMAATSEKYLINRENCIDIYEVFEELRYDLSYLDMKIGYVSYNKKNNEYKLPLLDSDKKIGMILVDEFGNVRIIYDKLQAMELNPVELEVQIEVLLSSTKMDIIDSLMSILQFARPIPINHDSCILYINDFDKEIIMDFFDEIYMDDSNKSIFNRPYFLTIDEKYNNEHLSFLIADKMQEVISIFKDTKNQFFNGLTDDLTTDDLEVIDSLIEFTIEDALFYENILNTDIVNKLNLE